MKFRIFISSVQDEFAAERRKLKDWLGSDPFISRFVESVFLWLFPVIRESRLEPLADVG